MGQDLSWLDAITAVLKEAKGPMKPQEISEEIVSRQLRTKLGATPTATVGAVIYTSLKNDGVASPFDRVDKALFKLREPGGRPSVSVVDKSTLEAEASDAESDASKETGIINALGMFWERGKVLWKTQPNLWGQEQVGSSLVDFAGQEGVYLLHDVQGVVYVGRAIDQPLGQRLRQHTNDRLAGRWDRFSWFGVYPVNSDGTLRKSADLSTVGVDIVIATMEALLIESLEPRQNRKRGDDLIKKEFIQSDDPQIELQRKKAILGELSASLSAR